MKMRLRKNTGIATLEAAGALLILFSLLICGFGLVEYMRISRNLSELINKHVYDTALKPYKLGGNFNSEAGSGIQLNKAALEQYIDDVSDDVGSDLEEYLSRVIGNPSAGFVIESAYAELKIDTDSGKSEGLNKTPHSYHKLGGNQSLQSYMDKDIILASQFDEYTKKEVPISDDADSGKRSYFAVPNARFSLSDSNAQFLPTTVLIGVRAGVSLEDTLIGSMLELLGRDAFLSDFKIVTLRGEISDEI